MFPSVAEAPWGLANWHHAAVLILLPPPYFPELQLVPTFLWLTVDNMERVGGAQRSQNLPIDWASTGGSGYFPVG